MKLNELAPSPGANKAKKRVGRGIGSGMGKTSTRGHKGQRARSGTATTTYEGGQMPIYMRLPKRGFKNPFKTTFSPINLDSIQTAIDAGRLDAGQAIDLQALRSAGLIGKRRDGIRLLGRGDIKTAVTIKVDSASKSAAEAIEKAGGTLELVSSADLDRAAKTSGTAKTSGADKASGAGKTAGAGKLSAKGKAAKAKTASADDPSGGSRPEGLSGPEGDADDLKKITGVGPKLETTLNELGIYHYRQIAAFTPDNVAWVDDYLSFKGRIDRDDWIGQAKTLDAETGSGGDA